MDEPGTLTLRVRPDSLWMNGIPVFDAFMAVLEPYPHAFSRSRSAPVASDEMPWLSAEEYFDLLLAVPPHEDLGERPDSSWLVALGWQSDNAHLAERYPATALTAQVAGAVVRAEAGRVLRSITPPIAGTWQMSLTLDGGPARTFYMRTRPRPIEEWRRNMTPPELVDPLDEPARPEAYSVLASVAGSVDELPTDCMGTRDVSAEGYVHLLDPPVEGGRRQTSWRGWLEVRLVTRSFRGDSALEEFRQREFEEWAVRWRSATDLEAPARFWYAGDVLRVEQTSRLEDGRALSVTGERSSDRTIDCSW